jgi:hypothetical protein
VARLRISVVMMTAFCLMTPCDFICTGFSEKFAVSLACVEVLDARFKTINLIFTAERT